MSGKPKRKGARQNGPKTMARLDSVQRLFNEALGHHQAGQVSEAEGLYRRILSLDSEHADSWHLLGVAAFQKGRPDQAIELIGKAIAIFPKTAFYHSNLGLALKDLGRLDEAVASFETALGLLPDYADAWNNIGLAYQGLGRPDQAVSCYRKTLILTPDRAEASYNLGNALRDQGLGPSAVRFYRQALAVKPEYPEACNNLGNALKEMGYLHDAIRCFLGAVAVKPDNADAHNNLGVTLSELGELAEAECWYRRAVAVQPDYAEVHNNLGVLLKNMGRLAEARLYLEKSVELAPKRAVFHFNLANSRRYKANDPHLAVMELLDRNPADLPLDERIHLQFALGKAYEDLGDPERSFSHLLLGNALKRPLIRYDEAATLALFERIRSVFTPEMIRDKSRFGAPSSRSVFILGMPRSGTSLVEQILASHKQVFGAGELDLFKQCAAATGGADERPEAVFDWLAEDIRRLGEDYLAGLAAKAPWARRITDKMPANFRYIGLIHMALPDARIIHTRRDPIDTCLSCFSKLFPHGQPHSYDLGELGRYYRAYERLMDHWRQALPPGVMIEVDYEDVVDDLDGQARRLVAHCGLEWDDACLAFHKTERVVRTASDLQVRQPIYKTSVGRWRPDPQVLRPLTDALADRSGTRAATPLSHNDKDHSLK